MPRKKSKPIDNHSVDSEAPGWKAIDASLYSVYGGIEPMHWGTIVSWRLGGRDPIHGISAYRNNRLRSHLHYITYGFSELWGKETKEPEISGFGFELTFRLAHKLDETPPIWALNFLQNLGRYVFNTGRVLGPGHSMPLNGPITVEQDTNICAIAFALDPELPPINSPNGRLAFLQIVGLTDDEFLAIQAWNASRFLDFVREQNELLITDLDRESYLTDANFSGRIQEATDVEGASAESLYCEHADFQCGGDAWCRLIFGTAVARDLARRLLGRIPYGRRFSVVTGSVEILFEPGDELDWQETAEGLRIALTTHHNRAFVDDLLKPQAGTYSSDMLPGLSVVIEKTVVKDEGGNIVGEIG